MDTRLLAILALSLSMLMMSSSPAAAQTATPPPPAYWLPTPVPGAVATPSAAQTEMQASLECVLLCVETNGTQRGAFADAAKFLAGPWSSGLDLVGMALIVWVSLSLLMRFWRFLRDGLEGGQA